MMIASNYFVHKLKQLSASLRAVPIALAAWSLFCTMPDLASAAPSWRQAQVINQPACNATAFSQIPGSAELFLGRYLLNASGQIASGLPANDCSGAKSNRWTLTLNRFDWSSGRMTVVKPILDTSLVPETKLHRAMVAGGSQNGLQLQSAYDPDVVAYNGLILVAFECLPYDGANYKVGGTSACIGVYDPGAQRINLARTKIIVTGHNSADRFVGAAVPKLLVYGGKLYIYWSCITVNNNPHKFLSIIVRGAQLEMGSNGEIVPAAGGALLRADDPTTFAVWTPTEGDPKTDTTVDIRQVWSSGNAIYAMAGVGGSGCVEPADGQPGCFRLMVARADRPLGNQVFKPLSVALPTNPQVYAHLARNPSGASYLFGAFYRPIGEFANSDPAPGAAFWAHAASGAGANYLTFFPIDLP
jgi:hypothetical protein